MGHVGGKVRGRTVRLAPAAIVAVLLLPSVGCGNSKERTSNLRPPVPVNVAVEIGQARASVSPRTIGAGPMIMTASNQTNASRQVTVDGPQLKRSVGPINPGDTAQLKVTLQSGSYTISADGGSGVKPATLRVGPKRPSAQNQLLQP
jgi:hypothetical protein